MKITEMLAREDFYAINERTLAAYFRGRQGRSELYVYPQLNAIVTKRPAKAVTDYLLCEYSVRANPFKRLLVRAYVWICLHSFGLMAAKKVTIGAQVSADTLIYPCNKKYRVFSFDGNTVDVIAKDGFDDSDLLHEIAFRSREDVPEFVPKLCSFSEQGYREQIIDGRPLARMTEGFEACRDAAYHLLQEYAQGEAHSVAGKAYAERLLSCLHGMSWDKVLDHGAMEQTLALLAGACAQIDRICVGMSHGDLQAGNIWVGNGTGKVYIIDWESWGERSSWYDFATLYHGLRPGDVGHFLNGELPTEQKAVVLLEDLIFRLTELNNLPEDFGAQQFNDYLLKVQGWAERSIQL